MRKQQILAHIIPIALCLAIIIMVVSSPYEKEFILNKNIAYLPIILFGVMALANISEYAFIKSKEFIYPYLRSEILVFVGVSFLFFLNNINGLNSSLMVGSILYLVYLLYEFISFLIIKKKYNYPRMSRNMFDQKYDFIVRLIIIGIVLVSYLIMLSGLKDLMIMIILIFILGLLVIRAFLKKISPILGNMVSNYENSLNYEELNKQMDRYLSFNLHPDMRNFLMSIKTSYTIFVDLDKAVSLIETIKEPKRLSYKITYFSSHFLISILQEDRLKSEEYLSLLQTSLRDPYIYKRFVGMYSVFILNKGLGDLTTCYQLKMTLYGNLVNSWVMMEHYRISGAQKKNEMVDYIYENGQALPELVRRAKK